MTQNNHTDQLDFSKLMFYKFIFSLLSIGNPTNINTWDSYATLNCEASGRKCCNVTKDTSRPKIKRSRCNFGTNQTNKVNSTETIENNQAGGNNNEELAKNEEHNILSEQKNTLKKIKQHATDAKVAVEKTTTKAKEKAKEAHTFMKSSTSNKRQSKIYSKRSGKISKAGFQQAQAVAKNLPYLEESIDSITSDPVGPSANSMTFDKEPYKPTNKTPSNYTQTLDKHLMKHDPLLLEIVNEIYDTMDTTTMTFLNKLFTNAIPYINRIKLYILLAEMFPALGIELEVLANELKFDPARADKYNKKIDENLRHLLYKYRRQVIKNRTESKIAWNKQKQKVKNTIKQSSGLDKQTT